MEITEFMTLLGTVGGVQGVVETMKWWQSRRVRRREQEAGVTALENENGRKQIDWLESRLAERDAKIDAIYKELRQEQGMRMKELHTRHEVELRLTEAEARKCCVRGCAGRVPPSEY
ncbi:MAG: hypothetical protein J5995_00745 [Muribaculaceae bacterium]|nr:hypothetical protein [Muribaculaceae bacterium]